MSNWEDLEEFVKSLIKFDNPVRTPLSGGTKHEEDVVGTNILAQCKFTSDKNISILFNDMARLCFAAGKLEKFPIFVSEQEAGKVVAVPITDSTELFLADMLKLAALRQGLDSIKYTMPSISTLSTLGLANKEVTRLKKLYTDLKHNIDQELNLVEMRISSKYVDLTTYNLFEGEANAPK